MKKPSRRLELVREYGQKAQQFLHDKSLTDWQHDEQLRFAVSHALAAVAENVKEYMQAVNKATLLRDYPHIPWNQIARFRDKMIHHYEGIDQDILFEFATLELEPLLQVISDILSKDSSGAEYGSMPERNQ